VNALVLHRMYRKGRGIRNQAETGRRRCGKAYLALGRLQVICCSMGKCLPKVSKYKGMHPE